MEKSKSVEPSEPRLLNPYPAIRADVDAEYPSLTQKARRHLTALRVKRKNKRILDDK